MYRSNEIVKRQQPSPHQLAELDCWRTATILDMLEFELLESVFWGSVSDMMLEKGRRTARSSHGSIRRL